jgi:hypothetical protein
VQAHGGVKKGAQHFFFENLKKEVILKMQA